MVKKAPTKKSAVKKPAVKRVRTAAKTSHSTVSERELHLLEGVTLGIFLALIFGVFAATSLGGIAIHTNQSAAVESAVLVDLTNENRAQNNLAGLSVNPVLVEAAQEKANDEAMKGYFAHTSPQGLDSWYWFKQVGYNFTYAGENLAVDFSDSAAVVNAWMNSPEHRANILDGHYTEIGIATAQGMYEGHPTIFVVQEFGSPSTPELASAPIAQATQPAEPTQIAEATTQVPTSTPQVLGQTAGEPSASAPSPIPTPAPEPAPVPPPAPQRAKVAVAEPSAQATLSSALTQAPGPMIADSQPITLPITSNTALGTPPERYASGWDFFVTSPQTTLRWAYYAIGFLVVLALFLTTGFEFKRHHMRHVAVAGSLLVIMVGLFFIADTAVFGHASIAQTTSASHQIGS